MSDFWWGFIMGAVFMWWLIPYKVRIVKAEDDDEP